MAIDDIAIDRRGGDCHRRVRPRSHFNRIAEKLTGWHHDEATSHTVDEVLALIDEDTGTPAENLVHKVLTDRAPVHTIEGAQLISRNGRKVAVEESAAPLVDP